MGACKNGLLQIPGLNWNILPDAVKICLRQLAMSPVC